MRTTLLIAGIAMLGAAGAAHADTGVLDWLQQGAPVVDLRARYENVSDKSKAFAGDASTLRLRLGYETAAWRGMSLAFDFDGVFDLWPADHNTTRNGRTAFPTIADPKGTALNRLQLTYASDFDTTLTAGRQRLQFGDQRFVGNAAWRQHEQTFDAVSVVNTSVLHLALTYAYVGQVNRVYGPNDPSPANGPAGRFGSDSHLFNALYTGIPGLKLESYVYLVKLDQNGPAPSMLATAKLSTATVGGRAEYRGTLADGIAWQANGAYAHQQDYAGNPLSLSLNYWLAEGSVSWAGVTALAGYEAMGGDGRAGFSTPLASLHPFDGWADLFTATPVNGIDDAYFKVSYTMPGILDTKSMAATLAHHDFRTDRNGTGIGSEWDASIEWALDAHFSLFVALANYQGSGIGQGGFADKSIAWVQTAYKL